MPSINTYKKKFDMIGESANAFTIGKYTTTFFSSTLSLFVDVKLYIWVTILFILMDLYYGVSVVYKNRDKSKSIFEIIDFSKLLKTVGKLKDYSILIIAAFTIDKFILTDPALYFTKVVTGIVCGSQFWSVLKHLVILKPSGPWAILKKFLLKKSSTALEIEEPTLEKLLDNSDKNDKK